MPAGDANEAGGAEPRAMNGDLPSTSSDAHRPEGAERGERGERGGRGRRGRGRDRQRGEGRDGATEDAEAIAEVRAAGDGRDDAASPADSPRLAAPEASASAEGTSATSRDTQPEAAGEATAAPVAAAPMAAAASAATPASAPAVAAAPKPAEPFVLPMAALHQLAEAAGLTWVNSDADKVRSVQEAIAAEPRPIHVPRERKPLVVEDVGPLVLVETRKDLAQLKLPFEQGA